MIKGAHRKLDFLIVGVAPVGMLLMLIWFAATASGPTRREVVATCAKAGYPELIYAGDQPYCRRLLNGTDELVPVEQVQREDRRRRAVESYRRAWGEPDQSSTPETEHPTLSDKEPQ